MKKPCNGCKLSREDKTEKTVNHVPGDIKCLECEQYKKYRQFRESKCTYKKGEQISSITEFEAHIPDRFMYWNDRVKHCGWLVSLQYRTVQNAIKAGRLYTAIKK